MKILNRYRLSALALVATCLASSCAPAKVSEEPANEKIVIYQIFTRLFGSDKVDIVPNGGMAENGVGKFEDFTVAALDSIHSMGITHVWYTGVIEHASIYSVDTVGGVQMNHPGVIKGKAGSPYAIKDYYDVNAYLATSPERRMEEFESLVERTHAADMKVIIDFVPNHVARGYHSDVAPEGVEQLGAGDDTSLAFSAQNNFYYLPGEALEPQFSTVVDGSQPYVEFPAKVTGNDVFSASPCVNDWYETVKLNYGVDYMDNRSEHFEPIPDTWVKMRDILLFWAGKGVDGFRCDMAEMTPCAFWGWAIESVKAQYPEIIFIAEIYNPAAYETYIKDGGFDYLYDKVGLYDTLKGVVQGRVASSAISEDRAKIAHVQSHMLNFLENHDEQRIAWREFAGDARAGIPMMLVSALSDNIPMMIYFGQEIGELSPDATGFSGADGRTTIFDFWTLARYQAWRNGGAFDGAGLTDDERALRADYISILKLASTERALLDGDFCDLTIANPSSSSAVYAFAKVTDNESVVVVANLSNEDVTTRYKLPADIDSTTEQTLFGESQTIKDGYLDVALSPYAGAVIKLK